MRDERTACAAAWQHSPSVDAIAQRKTIDRADACHWARWFEVFRKFS
jgi:hypothetical protein